MALGVAYPVAEALAVAATAAACVLARRRPGRPASWISRALALVLAADAVTFLAPPLVGGGFSASRDLPLQLCDVALLVAALACWWPRWQLGVELTYFWGLAGCLQAVVTPDLYARFPQLDWFEFVVGHLGVVLAAIYLVAGLGRRPRPAAGGRVLAVTAAFTAGVGVVDRLTGANYMYLRRIPGHASLLSLLGPWPYYILSTTGVAVVAFAILSVPFAVPRRRSTAADASSPAVRTPIGQGVLSARTRRTGRRRAREASGAGC